VKLNPIPEFKDQCLALLIGVLIILAYIPFNLELDVMVQVFNKRSFFKIILALLNKALMSLNLYGLLEGWM